MRIEKMIDGGLYSIKSTTMVDIGITNTTNEGNLPVLRGWRCSDVSINHQPFVYLGWKMEDWKYHYQGTHKIHYILWRATVFVMDNQFAKHVVPLTEEFCE